MSNRWQEKSPQKQLQALLSIYKGNANAVFFRELRLGNTSSLFR